MFNVDKNLVMQEIKKMLEANSSVQNSLGKLSKEERIEVEKSMELVAENIISAFTLIPVTK